MRPRNVRAFAAGTSMVLMGRPGERVSASETPILHIQLLGGFAASVGARAIDDSEWYLRKAKHLIKLLALAPDHRLHRGDLMEVLWPDLDIDAAANNLHKVLHIARHVLEPDLPAKMPSAYVHMSGEFVFIGDEGLVSVDVESFKAAVRAARETKSLNSYRDALRLYGGELLPEDRYEEWASRHREQLQVIHAELLLEVAAIHEHDGHADLALDVLRRLVTSDPAHEAAQMRLMHLLARSGQRQLALRQYQQLCDALSQELDAEPSSSAKTLYQQILVGETSPVLERSEDTISSIQSGLKARSLVGRETELARLGEELTRLLDGRGNLVFVTGEAGIGKSRLAAEMIETAARQGVITLWGAAYQYEVAQPYQVFAAVLEGFALRVAPASLRSLVGSDLALAKLVPGIARALELDAEAASSLDADDAAIIEATAGLFLKLAGLAPVVIVLEDLELADKESLRLLEHVTGGLRNSPILILGTYNPADVIPGSPLDTLSQALDRDNLVTRLNLERMGIGETELLVRELLGSPVDQAVVHVVHGLAEGNLHYTEEAVRAIRGRKRIAHMDGQWRMRDGIIVTWGCDQLRKRPGASGDFRLASLIRASGALPLAI